MAPIYCAVLFSAVTLACAQALPVWGATEEVDPLSLESAPEAATPAATGVKIFLEGSGGNVAQRYETQSRDIGRASLDFSYSTRLAPGLRAVLSDRIDHLYPAETGVDSTVNSLREAYLSWQPEGSNTAIELGRINLRYGPGYGYNPTDFFRDGSLRTLTSTNPFAMRENRLGTVMLRAQQLWSGGSLSVAYSPKLEDRPSADGMSLDFGATNNRNRALIELSTQFSQRISSQVMLYKEQDSDPAIGASLSALVSDGAVAHAEWSRSSEPTQLNRALGISGPTAQQDRFAGGLTYTTLGKLSLTAEYQYNGFGTTQRDWESLASKPLTKFALLTDAQQRQELVPRQAYLFYVTQKSFVYKDFDLTAFVRVNAEDQSHLSWLELRHHWPKFDLALQWQQYSGSAGSEYGIVPETRVIQILANYYF